MILPSMVPLMQGADLITLHKLNRYMLVKGI